MGSKFAHIQGWNTVPFPTPEYPRPKVRVGFLDFHDGFDARYNFFTRLLAPHYDLVLSDDPDFLFFSCFGRRHLLHRGTRIYVSAENLRWDFSDCDFAFTPDLVDDPRHLRLPTYVRTVEDPTELVKGADYARLPRAHARFCGFLSSNPKATFRDRFFEMLSEYKQVASGGAHLNNLGFRVADHREFLATCKFSMCFENSSYPGYTTEKLTQAMLAGSLPIYWGNEMVNLDFDTSSFINVHDYANLEAVVDRVIAVDQDDDLYLRYLDRPWFHENRVNDYFDEGRLLDRFHQIFTERRRSARTSLRNRIDHAAPRAVKAVTTRLANNAVLYRAARAVWRRLGLNRRFSGRYSLHRREPPDR